MLVGRGLFAGRGLAIGDGRSTATDPGWDKAEAEALYSLLRARKLSLILQCNEDIRNAGWRE